MNLYIDIGGTYIRYKIDSFEIKKCKQRNFIMLIEELLKKSPKIKKIFISFAGQVNNGVISSAPNINIENLNIKEYFKNYEVYIENDLNCAVLAESDFYKERDIVALYIGTGIGSGIISNGNLIKGVNNFAGEIGHIPFKKAPFKCGCGKDNCIELYSSGKALEKWEKYKNIEKIKKLNNAPIDVIDNFLEGVMVAVSNLITIFNPKIVVLGGGVVENNQFILDYVNQNIFKYAFNPSLNDIKIVKSKLKEAPLIGSGLLDKISL
jgi:glucokinase